MMEAKMQKNKPGEKKMPVECDKFRIVNVTTECNVDNGKKETGSFNVVVPAPTSDTCQEILRKSKVMTGNDSRSKNVKLDAKPKKAKKVKRWRKIFVREMLDLDTGKTHLKISTKKPKKPEPPAFDEKSYEKVLSSIAPERDLPNTQFESSPTILNAGTSKQNDGIVVPDAQPKTADLQIAEANRKETFDGVDELFLPEFENISDLLNDDVALENYLDSEFDF